MRRMLLLLGFSMALGVQLKAQTPAAFKYQTVCRDASGLILNNQLLGFKLSLLQGSPNGPTVFSETHSSASNDFGVVNLNVGQGNLIQGNIQNLDWINNSYFLKVEFDPSGQSNYLFMGSSQIMAVPYALNAKHAQQANRSLNDQDTSSSNEIQTLSIVGNQLQISGGNSVTFTGVVDLDPDPTNELQVLQLSNDTLFLSSGNFVVLPPDADGDSTNELQALSLTNDTLFLSSGNFVVLPPDADGDSTNELQTLTYANDSLSISLGNTVPLPAKTPWYKAGGTTDAAADKTGNVYRPGSVGIGSNPTPDSSAVLDLNANDKGFLLPRLTTQQRNNISNPAIGLQVFNTSIGCLEIFLSSGWKKVSCDCQNLPNASFTFSPTTPGFGQNVAFSPVQAGLQYQWQFTSGNPATSVSSNPSVSWSGAGTYKVVLQVTDVNGCSSLDSQNVVVSNCQSGTNTFLAAGSLAGGTIQTFTLPSCVTSIIVEAWGGQGGGTSIASGGKGAYAKGTFSVTGGDIIRILVGQMGESGYSGQFECAGGGGGSFVTRNNNQPMLVAGGGGGAGTAVNIAISTPGSGQTGNNGTAGLGNAGMAGGISGHAALSQCGACGATGGAGLLSNSLPYPMGNYGTGAFAFVNGGIGSTSTSGTDGGFGGGGSGAGGGGGGGGYSGGGSGNYTSGTDSSGGGGGGSINFGTNQTMQSGVNLGHGKVVISW